MLRKRFTNGQIAFALRQAENSAMVDEVCRKMGVSEPTFYRWKKQFVGMGDCALAQLHQGGNPYFQMTISRAGADKVDVTTEIVP